VHGTHTEEGKRSALRLSAVCVKMRIPEEANATMATSTIITKFVKPRGDAQPWIHYQQEDPGLRGLAGQLEAGGVEYAETVSRGGAVLVMRAGAEERVGLDEDPGGWTEIHVQTGTGRRSDSTVVLEETIKDLQAALATLQQVASVTTTDRSIVSMKPNELEQLVDHG
jgi:hypothetical protein